MTVVTEKFVSLAKTSARALGFPDLRFVVVPHPFETLPRDRLREIATEKVAECIAQVCREDLPVPETSHA